jgi:hypothetical protein
MVSMIGSMLVVGVISLFWTNSDMKELREQREKDEFPKEPLTSSAKDYLRRRCEQIDISLLKKTPKYNGYTEDEIRFMPK